MAVRFVRVVLTDGTRFFLRVTSSGERLLTGYEVNHEGDEIRPKGHDRRMRLVSHDLIATLSEYRMNNTYGHLERIP